MTDLEDDSQRFHAEVTQANEERDAMVWDALDRCTRAGADPGAIRDLVRALGIRYEPPRDEATLELPL